MFNNVNYPVLKNLITNNYVPENLFKAPSSNLIYVPMLKCANTYYGNMFEANHWERVNFDSIDWNRDFVFSFIMDPYKRHIKGLVEDLCWLEETQELTVENLPDCVLTLAPVLGIHGLGYHQVYEENCKKIHWIPLDIEISSKEIFNDLLINHQVSWNWDISVWHNPSDPHQLMLFEKIYRLFDGPGKDWFNITNREDILLYHRAVADAYKQHSISKKLKS